MKKRRFKNFLRRLGLRIPLSPEEQGEANLREFADKAFNQPFTRRFGGSLIAMPARQEGPSPSRIEGEHGPASK